MYCKVYRFLVHHIYVYMYVGNYPLETACSILAINFLYNDMQIEGVLRIRMNDMTI